MSTVEPLSPWANGEQQGPALEPRLTQLFAAVPDAAALSEPARRRVAIRLRRRAAHGGGLMLVRLIAVGVVIGLAGAAAAQWAAVHWLGAQESFITRYTRVVTAAPPLVPQPALPRARSEPLVAPSAELPAMAPAAPPASALFAPAPAPAVASSRLGLEAASLEAALSTLHGGGSARAAGALKALDRHLQDFPHGALELEARVARVDALLVLGRRQDARRELSALPIENVGRKDELRLIRAELRADDDCRAALGDFQVLVAQPLAPAWAERALFGRGACLLKLGDKSAAGRDFARYLERFPAGRFAAQIRAQQEP